MLVLKLTDNKLQAHGGFQWPESGPVSAPDWSPRAECGQGLHGWANGEGAYRHSFNEGKWLVVDVADADVVSLDGGEKIKFSRGNVVFCGNRIDAINYLIKNGALTDKSNPAWACLTATQCVEVAMRAADRAVRKHAPARLRAHGMIAEAEKLEKQPPVTDLASAKNAANYAANAAVNAAYYAANAAYYAAYYAAKNAADAADAERKTKNAANAAYYAADAAYAANYAANAAVNAAYYAANAEREAVRLDKLHVLGILKVRMTEVP